MPQFDAHRPLDESACRVDLARILPVRIVLIDASRFFRHAPFVMPITQREGLGETARADKDCLLLRFDLDWFQPFEFDKSCHARSIGVG